MPEQESFAAFDAVLRADRELMRAAHEASDEVEKCELEYLDVEKELRGHRARVDNIEARVSAEVGREKDENDKPRFSNEGQRKAETALRLANDNAYRESTRILAEAESDQRVRRITIEKLLRTYSLNRLAFEAYTIGRRER